MADEHDFMRDVLRGDHTPQPGTWNRMRDAVTKIARGQPTTESIDLLVDLLDEDREVELHEDDPGHHHAASPHDTLRAHAIQTLGRWGQTRQLQDFVARTDSEHLAALARAFLKDTRAAGSPPA